MLDAWSVTKITSAAELSLTGGNFPQLTTSDQGFATWSDVDSCGNGHKRQYKYKNIGSWMNEYN